MYKTVAVLSSPVFLLIICCHWRQLCVGGSGCEVSTLPHLQHGAVTNYSMAGDREEGMEGGRNREGGTEGGREGKGGERERGSLSMLHTCSYTTCTCTYTCTLTCIELQCSLEAIIGFLAIRSYREKKHTCTSAHFWTDSTILTIQYTHYYTCTQMHTWLPICKFQHTLFLN